MTSEERLRNFINGDYFVYNNNFICNKDIEEILNQNQQLKDNWNKLGEWLKDKFRKYDNQVVSKIIDEEETYDNNYTDFDKTALALDLLNISMECVLSKMQEIGGSNE